MANVTHTFVGTEEGVKFVKQTLADVATAEVRAGLSVAKVSNNEYVLLDPDSFRAIPVPANLLNLDHPALQELNA